MEKSVKNQKNKKLWYILVPALAIILIIALLAGPVYCRFFSEKTFYNLKIGNINAGNKTEEQLKELLIKNIEAEKNVEISWEDTEFSVNMNDIGFNMDVEKTLENAMKAGKDSFFDAVLSFYFGTDSEFFFGYSSEDFKNNILAVMNELGIFKGNYSVSVKKDVAEFIINEDCGNPDTDSIYSEIIAKYPNPDKHFKLSGLSFEWPSAEQLQRDFDIEAADAYVDTSSGERKIINHKEGRKIDFVKLKEAIASGEKQFSVPYEIIKPKVYTDQLGDENFPVLLGKCVTYYNEGAYSRSHNVRLAASKINGYVMNKGDVFSFNEVVGKRTEATGFKKAPVYTATGVEDGIGGGICQVSSTLYGAVLQANLKIVSRRNHSYTVSYTKPGLDATVSYGTIDFKFRNDFKEPVRIKTVAQNGALTVYIYGTKQNDNIVSVDYKILSTKSRGVKRVLNQELEVGQEIVKNAGYDGMLVQNYKYIKSPSGEILKTEDLGVSNYIVLDKLIEYNDGSGVIPEKVEPEVEKTEEIQTDLPIISEEEPIIENPTQENPELDPEYSGNAEANIPISDIEDSENDNEQQEI